VLLVALAAALFTHFGGQPSGPAATPAPAAACASILPGASPAAAITGFSGLTFPAGAVMTATKSSFGGASQFTVLETDVCYSGTAGDLTGPAGASPSVTAALLHAGWSASPSFPYPGDLLQSCTSQCYQLDHTHYVGLERITDHGSRRFTYHLRLAAPPAAPTCNSNFAGSPIHGAQTTVEGVPLPPVTFVVPDDAANIRGYDLCSSGTASSVSAFLARSLPADSWAKSASDPHCFYSDQCWTKGGNVISWHVDDPTDWHIASHPSTP
jgi:hypothetical protein